jgi:tetratricopeptide (TPR) repeat protein
VGIVYLQVRGEIIAANQPGNQFKSVIAQAQEFDRLEKYNEEQQVLLKYLATNPPQKYRYQVLTELGVLAYDDRQDSAAITYDQEAVSANGGKLTELAAEDMGQAAAAEGNKALALEYFKQALQLASAQPADADDVADLTATVQNLESSQ